jgi:large subunit ribosomal protein L10
MWLRLDWGIAMNKNQKIELGKGLRDKLERAQVMIIADYKGLTANQADEFRKRVRDAKGEVKTLKNNIARKAVADGSFGDDAKLVMDGRVGPTLVAFG